MSTEEKVMQELLGLWDWYRRMCDDDYSFGYTDAIGQCILSVGKIYGEGHTEDYKFEAYKRVMQDTTQGAYWKRYPKPISDVFPAEEIRRHGGQL
jgi:hypothetical protein